MNGDTSAEKVITEQLLQKGWSYNAEHNLLRPPTAGEVAYEHKMLDDEGTHSSASMASLIGLVGFLGE